MAEPEPPLVEISLAAPPEVHAQGRSTHGIGRLEDRFQLPRSWSLHLYDYRAELEVDGRTFEVAPGTVSLVPPAARIRYRYQGPSTHLYAHLGAVAGPATRLPMIMSPGAELPMITDLMTSAVSSAAFRPERTRADIWGVLLRLSDRPLPRRPASPTHDHVVAAMAYIESRLTDRLTVPQVAAAAGISANHLTRLFAAEVEQTVVGYIRRRRIEHARRLLTSSTMSISAIAAAVGFPDLQAFNKACRAVTGQSPRRLREGPR
ncbi:MAG TPA: AraC family transcriptional regulator [Microlunatus sp.]|nr:AraC family transcriptional regulator [Microlunatus sp.]